MTTSGSVIARWCSSETTKTLATGAAGFIGTHLVEALLRSGDEEVVCWARPRKNPPKIFNDRRVVVATDIRDRRGWGVEHDVYVDLRKNAGNRSVTSNRLESRENGLMEGKISLLVIAQGFAIVIVVGTIGVFLPAIRASRLTPSEALRH